MMKEKVRTWIDRMEAWKVPAPLRMLSYKTALWPAIKYPLGVSQLSEKEIKDIFSQLMPVLKHASYLSSKFSDTLMKLPAKYGGYGVKDVSTAMAFEQVRMFLSTYRTGGNMWMKLRALLEYHQLESGSKVSVLGEVQTGFLLTKSWLKVLIGRLRKMDLWLKVCH